MRKHLFRAAALGLAAALALAVTGCNVPTGSRLTVGVKGDVPNFGLYDDETGNYSGMEVELADLLCRDLGYAGAKFVTVVAADRETMLNSGQVDFILATYTVTEERREEVNFTDIYYRDCCVFVVENSSLIQDAADLAGCTLGFLRGSALIGDTVQYLHTIGVVENYDADTFDPDTYTGSVKIAQYDTYEALSDALEWGDVDALVGDKSIVMGYVDSDRAVLSSVFAIQEYAAATGKQSGLYADLAAAMAARLSDGTVDKLIAKWGN